MKIRSKILLAFMAVILFLSVSTSLLMFYIVKRYVVDEAQEEVNANLNTARTVYNNQLEEMAVSFHLATPETNLIHFQAVTGLDYLELLSPEDAAGSSSEIVRRAFAAERPVGGTRLIRPEELATLERRFYDQAVIDIRKTPKARPSQKEQLKATMSIEYAKPFVDRKGRVKGIIYGGKIINRNYEFIDEISDAVFQREIYDDKLFGTVTIFLDDVRIATNVLDREGKRAVGTRVSEIVYKKVIEQGERWQDRAFVVTDWYRTAYEPIRDINGNIIGILYVGILEKPFIDLQVKIFWAFFGIMALGAVLAMAVSYLLSAAISRPMVQMHQATAKIAEGDFSVLKDGGGADSIEEFLHLQQAFNVMADKLREREASLKDSKERVEVLNKRYLDLVGFVSHELKGILSSLVLNVYLLQNKVLGGINEKQEKTLRSVARNLDYLTTTVKNFLSLSRIEKGELHLNIGSLNLREHVMDPAAEAFAQQAQEKDLTIENNLAEDITVEGDAGLLQIVANNLLSNAVKYGKSGGRIKITSKSVEDMVEIEVYNDGKPIADVDLDKLFRKFSRVIYTGMEKVKGTGVGLFITREIVEQHGGTIKAVPREKGNSFIFTMKKDLNKTT